MEIENIKNPVYTNGKTGWPWTITEHPNDKLSPKRIEWPRISVVTPSFNQGQYIEETIRSVLLQGYPNLEYIIMDGGSTDNTVEIIKKYQPWINCWVSEKDRGQSHAINKGFEKATGHILAWLNSDDLYAPNVLNMVAVKFNVPNMNWLAGQAYAGGEWNSHGTPQLKAPSMLEIKKGRTFFQPSCFFTRNILDQVGPLDESLHYVMDYDLWIRFLKISKYPLIINQPLSLAREHAAMKTQPRTSRAQWAEKSMIMRRHFGNVHYAFFALHQLLTRVRKTTRSKFRF